MRVLALVIVLAVSLGAKGFLAATLSPPVAAAASSGRPNIVVIVTDDQDVASITSMPQVQALLAAQGTTFTNAFVTTPLCCPSRTSLFRGQYAHNHGVLRNSPPGGGLAEFVRRGDEQSTLATGCTTPGTAPASSASSSTALNAAFSMEPVSTAPTFLRGGMSGTPPSLPRISITA